MADWQSELRHSEYAERPKRKVFRLAETPYVNQLCYKPPKTYLARFRVKGKLIRQSLKTKGATGHTHLLSREPELIPVTIVVRFDEQVETAQNTLAPELPWTFEPARLLAIVLFAPDHFSTNSTLSGQ